jgi:hypothetical protein
MLDIFSAIERRDPERLYRTLPWRWAVTLTTRDGKDLQEVLG